jgi:hypothetical protein
MPIRRDVLRAMAASAASLALGPARGATCGPAIVAGFVSADGQAGLGLWTRHAAPERQVSLPARVHAVTTSPDGRRCVAVGRRPGRFGVMVDLADFERSLTFEAAPGRSFFGHGQFADGGRLFLTTECDDDTGEGLVGVRDVRRDYALVAEWRSGGVGPHDLALSADGSRLLVANGGIDFSPAYDRAPLNDGGIAASIAALDLASGRQERAVVLDAESASLSVRHLAPVGDTLVFGCEETRRDGAARPLVGLVGSDGQPRFVDPPVSGWARYRGAIGEVAVDAAGRIVAATSPRGGLCGLWDVATGAALGEVSLGDCCGIGAMQDGFAVSSGLGMVAVVSPGRLEPILTGSRGFDNHLAVTPAPAML